ncbi:MAG TPA: hypothetical protein VJ832_13330 [Variovorax sp.]|nr:hypothetical protein [Variovorax sp.]
MTKMRRTTSPALRRIALLLLCAACLQGGLQKAFDIPVAIGGFLLVAWQNLRERAHV